MPRIVFNGKSYDSVDEMPAGERLAFEQLSNMFVDRNGNGIPDFLEGDMVQNVLTAFTSNVNFDGQTYNNVNDLPPEIRAKVQGAFERLSQLGIITQVPPTVMQQPMPQVGREPSFRSSEPVISREYSPTIQEDRGSPWTWIFVAVGVGLCVIVIAAAALFMLAGWSL